MPAGDRVRVLHVVCPARPAPLGRPPTKRDLAGSDMAVAACRVAIEATRDRCSHRVLVVGSADAERRVRELGFGAVSRVSPPIGSAWTGARSVRRFAVQRGPFDTVQCWGEGAFACARGIDGALAPRPDLPLIDLTPRDEARRRLGLADDRIVITLVGDPPGACDARRFVQAVGVFALIEPRAAGVIPHGSAQQLRGLAMHRGAGIDWPLRVAEAPIPDWLGAGDFAVYAPRDANTSPPAGTRTLIASLHHAGVPVVTTRNAAPAELYPESSGCMLSESGAASHLSAAMLRVWEREGDRRGLMKALAKVARAHDPKRFVSALRDRWMAHRGVS